MTYLVQIEDSGRGRDLINFLKNLNYVKIYSTKYRSEQEIEQLTGLFSDSGSPLTIEEFDRILDEAESSDDVLFEDALESSKMWKIK